MLGLISRRLFEEERVILSLYNTVVVCDYFFYKCVALHKGNTSLIKTFLFFRPIPYCWALCLQGLWRLGGVAAGCGNGCLAAKRLLTADAKMTRNPGTLGAVASSLVFCDVTCVRQSLCALLVKWNYLVTIISRENYMVVWLLYRCTYLSQPSAFIALIYKFSCSLSCLGHCNNVTCKILFHMHFWINAIMLILLQYCYSCYFVL